MHHMFYELKTMVSSTFGVLWAILQILKQIFMCWHGKLEEK